MSSTRKTNEVPAEQLSGASNQNQSQACSRCGTCCTKGGPGFHHADKGLIEIIRYDSEIRKLVVSDGGLEVEMLDFLFGRPLIKTIRSYGLRVVSTQKMIRLAPARTQRPPMCCDDETDFE